MSFTGVYYHTMDPKGRLTLPASFRKELGTELKLVPYGKTLRGYTPEALDAWVNSRFPEGPKDRKSEQLIGLIYERTATLDIDKSGRVCIAKAPEQSRKLLGDEHELALVGERDHIKILTAAAQRELEAQTADLDIADLFFDE